jgi:hypothetical protein
MLKISLYIVQGFIDWYQFNYIRSFEELYGMYNTVKEAQQFAWDDIMEPFRVMFRQFKQIYLSFEWSIFSYENFMNKWLGSYKKENIKLFVL